MIAMGNPDSASLTRSSTGRQAMGSAASTVRTTQPEFTARGAGRAFTGSESETAACPATATQKVLSVLDVTALDSAGVSRVWQDPGVTGVSLASICSLMLGVLETTDN